MYNILQERADIIRDTLRTAYPDVNTQLRHTNPFELLIAVILSAQCTDKQVNSVTPGLFAVLKSPQDYSHITFENIEQLIKPTGYYRNKARHIHHCCRILTERHQGVVPAALEELVQLPGVGRKTANVVLGSAFGIPGMVVDTHVARISGRLELTRHKQPEKIEQDLMSLIPEQEWNSFGLRLIYFGRETCKARKPECFECILSRVCFWAGKIEMLEIMDRPKRIEGDERGRRSKRAKMSYGTPA